MPDENFFKFPWLIRHLQKKIHSLELKLFKTSLHRFLKSTGTVVDLPSGDGILLPLLQGRHLTVYAVNSNLPPAEQKNWNRPGAPIVTFQSMDPKKLLFPDNAFDYVTTRGLLESLNEADRKRALQEIIRVTRNMFFIAIRTTGFSLTTAISSIVAPELAPPSFITLKELRSLLDSESKLQLLELRNAGGLDRSFVIAVLQKKN
jgi:hypothetical protein